jgi:radical SAM protein with 4Fe4S-binding SPASM domain
MTFVQLHDDSFVRLYGGFALLANQRTKVNHIFNERERALLGALSREPTPVTQILATLEAALPGETRLELRRMLTRLIQILDAEGYVVTGPDPRALKVEARSKALYRRSVRRPLRAPIGVPLDAALHCARHFFAHPTVFAMQMDLTSACNLRCGHCYLPPGRPTSYLDRELAFDVLDQLPELGTLSLTLTGGEPTLHPHFDEILERARRNDLTITIQTNATTITPERVASLVAANVNSVGISVYSMVAEDHDAVTRSPGSLERTLTAIEMLRAERIGIYLSTHVMRQNRRSYRSVLQWGVENRIKVVADLLMLARTDFSTDNLDCRLCSAQTADVIGEMLESSDEYGKGADRGTKVDPTLFATHPVCGVGTDSICLAADGSYYPCAGFLGFEVGDARRQRLAAVWNDSTRLKELRKVRWSDFPGCSGCEAFQYCSMCLARNFNENDGDMFRPVAQNCQVSHINRRVVEEHWRRADEGARRPCES